MIGRLVFLNVIYGRLANVAESDILLIRSHQNAPGSVSQPQPASSRISQCVNSNPQ